MHDYENAVLIIAPDRDAAAYLACQNDIPLDKFQNAKIFRVVTDIFGLASLKDRTPCLIDFKLFGKDNKPFIDMLHTMLAQYRIRRISHNELRKLCDG